MFVMVKHIPTRTAKKTNKYFKRFMKIYFRSGMIVQTLLMAVEFDNIIDKLMVNVVVETSTSKEHISEIERGIFTAKERSR